MSQVPRDSPTKEETPVDDVRRVRERLSRETGNDVNRLVDRVSQEAERLRDRLGLKPAVLSPRN